MMQRKMLLTTRESGVTVMMVFKVCNFLNFLSDTLVKTRVLTHKKIQWHTGFLSALQAYIGPSAETLASKRALQPVNSSTTAHQRV